MIALLCAYGALIIFLVLCSAQAVRPLVPSFCLVTVAALGAFGAVGVAGFVLWLAFVCALTVVYHYHAVIVPPLEGELVAAEDARDVFKAHRDEQTAKVRDLRAAALDDAGEIAYQSEIAGRALLRVDRYGEALDTYENEAIKAGRRYDATEAERRELFDEKERLLNVVDNHETTIRLQAREIEALRVSPTQAAQHVTAVDLNGITVSVHDVASELAYTVSQYRGILTALGHDAGILTSEEAADAVTRMETETAARSQRIALLDLVRYSVPFLPCGRERNDAKRLTDVCTVIDVEFDDLPKGADATP